MAAVWIWFRYRCDNWSCGKLVRSWFHVRPYSYIYSFFFISNKCVYPIFLLHIHTIRHTVTPGSCLVLYNLSLLLLAASVEQAGQLWSPAQGHLGCSEGQRSVCVHLHFLEFEFKSCTVGFWGKKVLENSSWPDHNPPLFTLKHSDYFYCYDTMGHQGAR